MAQNYSSVPEKDLASGINQQAPEDSIPAGFVEHALNVDFNSEGLVEKRAGFRNYLGNLPIRVAAVSQLAPTETAPGKIIFNLTSNEHPNQDVDLSNIPPGPIFVLGKTGNQITEFGTKYAPNEGIPTPVHQYYPTFESNPRKTIPANQPGALSFPNAEHGFSTSNLFVGVTESKSQTNKDNQHLFLENISIDTTSYDVTLNYDNEDGEITSFVYALAAEGSGVGYAKTFTGTTVSIPAAEHSLNTFNILCRTYEVSGTTLNQVIAESIVVNENSGNVTVTFSESGTYKIVLYAAPVAQQFIDSVISGATPVTDGGGSFTIPDLEQDFIFLDCYLRDADTGNLTKVMPDEVKIDTVTSVATVEFYNPFEEEANIVFCWEYAKVKTTTLTVTANTTIAANAEDEQPELCIYGLVAEEIFPSKDSPRSGWIQHIDTYKSEGYNTVVAGMGWNLFQAVKQPDAASYLRSTVFYPSLRARARASTFLGPLFQETVEDPIYVKRTRGAITFQGGASGWASIKEITWSEDDQGYWIVLDTPDRAAVIKGSQPLLVPFTTSTRWGDLLNIRGAELRSFEGDWPIWGTDDSVVDEYRILIKPSFTSEDYNCLASGEAGVFTDRFAINHRPLLTVGDTITAQSFPQGTQLSYIGTDRSANPYLYVSGVVEEIQVANGQLLNLARQSKYCYGPRSADGQTRTFNSDIVALRGDSIIVSGRENPVEIKHVVSQELSNITATISSEVLTLTNVSNARQFSVGQRVLLHDLGYDAQEFEVTEIGIDNTTLTLSAPGVLDLEALSGCKILPQLEFSEVVSIADDSFNRGTFTVEGRWEAVEKPQVDFDNLNAYNAVAARATEHFKADEYGTQTVVRSTMSQNNLYLTNSKDPVQKFDGFNLYRAGIIRWNPQLFIRHKHSGPITRPEGAAEATCWYYFRIGGRDSNGNFIVGPTTGVADYKIKITKENNTILLRLVGLPVWDNYDYEKLTVQVYRTKFFAEDPIAPFYQVAEFEMPQTAAAGYIDFVDTEPDVTLSLLPQDDDIDATANDVLRAVTLSAPPRAKYITALNNRIVLGNLRGYQSMDLRFVKTNASIDEGDFVGKTCTIYNDSNDLVSTGPQNQFTFEYVGHDNIEDFPTLKDELDSIQKELDEQKNPTGYLTVPVASLDRDDLVVGDWIYLFAHGTGTQDPSANSTEGLGWYQITDITRTADQTPLITSFQIYAPNESGPNFDATSFVVRSASSPVGTVPILLDDHDFNFEYVGSFILNIATITHRTAAAINCAMRQLNTNLAGQEDFQPWLIADAGGEFNLGEIRFRKPKDGTSFAFRFRDIKADVSIVYRGLQFKKDDIILESFANVYPSRIVYSYQNYPELFNKVDKQLITNADSDTHLPVDVNAADGQEITGIIPFFGESAFGQATRESLLVVFKTNSIYLVDLRLDNSANVVGEVQKIESNGLGCTAPYSIASTKDGIMFANESGIYKLTRQLTIEPLGQFVDRIWREEVDLNQLALTQGHHFGVGRQYKLSVPLQDGLNNTDVLVYEHTRESRGAPGAWGRYDNHEATGWANLLDQEFFGTVHGRVCTRNNSASQWDFSDRGTAIVATVDLRPNDLGIPNIRKRLLHLSVHFRNPQENGLNLSQKSTTVSLANDLQEDYYECNKYESQGLFSKTGISDLGLLKGETIRFSVPTSKGVHFQPRIENAGLYETLQFSGVTYRVAALSSKGTKEAADTEK